MNGQPEDVEAIGTVMVDLDNLYLSAAGLEHLRELAAARDGAGGAATMAGVALAAAIDPDAHRFPGPLGARYIATEDAIEYCRVPIVDLPAYGSLTTEYTTLAPDDSHVVSEGS